MSFDPIKQPIAPFKLFNDALAQVVPVYFTLLIISSPGILVTLLQNVVPQSLKPAVALVYLVTIAPVIGGIGMYFNYRYLQQGTIDLRAAIDKALAHSLQLILGSIIYFVATIVGTICLVIPGLYIAVRFGFVLYAVISENCSAIDGFKYSSKLVAGRWWDVFGSFLVVIILLIPLMIIAAIMGAILIKQPASVAIINAILGALVTPPIMLYYVKLYLRLQETANV